MSKLWPALILRSQQVDDSEDLVSAVLADFSPVAIHDLAERPLPPGGLWDPTYPPIPDPPPTPLHWNVCFSDAAERDRAADAIRDALPDVAIERVDLPDEDWAARSQQSLKAIRAGRFIVAPPWDLPADGVGATVIVIEPSMGFGTGHHETTRLCLRLLQEVDLEGRRVVDLGTGSGVLAMAAHLLGAREVEGLDFDDDALVSARESLALNGLTGRIALRRADLRTDRIEPADVILANLTGGLLIAQAPLLVGLATPGGRLVLSGFQRAEADAVQSAFGSTTALARVGEGDWEALLLQIPT